MISEERMNPFDPKIHYNFSISTPNRSLSIVGGGGGPAQPIPTPAQPISTPANDDVTAPPACVYNEPGAAQASVPSNQPARFSQQSIIPGGSSRKYRTANVTQTLMEIIANSDRRHGHKFYCNQEATLDPLKTSIEVAFIDDF